MSNIAEAPRRFRTDQQEWGKRKFDVGDVVYSGDQLHQKGFVVEGDFGDVRAVRITEGDRKFTQPVTPVVIREPLPGAEVAEVTVFIPGRRA